MRRLRWWGCCATGMYIQACDRRSPVTEQAAELPLKLVQTAAVLEIVHAATGLVRAPVFTTRALPPPSLVTNATH